MSLCNSTVYNKYTQENLHIYKIPLNTIIIYEDDDQ